jgi:hypothetical protein
MSGAQSLQFNLIATLTNSRGKPIVIPGLWSLDVGNGTKAGLNTAVYFTAGINGQSGGLIGLLQPAASKV